MSKEQKDLEKKANELGEELGEEDMADVAGGGVCVCVIGGGGKADSPNEGLDETCGCVIAGNGFNKRSPNNVISDLRCTCLFGGGGDDM
jgi:hypothetical protein